MFDRRRGRVGAESVDADRHGQRGHRPGALHDLATTDVECSVVARSFKARRQHAPGRSPHRDRRQASHGPGTPQRREVAAADADVSIGRFTSAGIGLEAQVWVDDRVTSSSASGRRRPRHLGLGIDAPQLPASLRWGSDREDAARRGPTPVDYGRCPGSSTAGRSWRGAVSPGRRRRRVTTCIKHRFAVTGAPHHRRPGAANSSPMPTVVLGVHFVGPGPPSCSPRATCR